MWTVIRIGANVNRIYLNTVISTATTYTVTRKHLTENRHLLKYELKVP